MKQALALILTLCLALSALSCTVVSRPQATTETVEKVTLTKEKEEKEEIYVMVNGEKLTPDYVLELDGKKISFEEFRYNYLLQKETALQGKSAEEAAAYWTEENEKKLLDDTVEAIRNEHAYLEFAASNNIVLTEEDQKTIDTQIQQAKGAYGEATLLKQLQGMYIPDYDFYRLLVERNTLTQNYIPEFFYGENGTRLFDDAQLDAYVQKNHGCTMREYYENKYLRAKHILIKFVSGETADSCPQTLSKINAVYEELQNGLDFDEGIKKYNEDPGMSANPDGYLFKEGTMVDEFYKGTLALEPDSYSQPVKSSHGFHIILRLPLTDEGMETIKQEMLFGNNELPGAYKEDFQTYTGEISKGYTPEIKFNPLVEGHINHDSVF